MDVTPTSNVAVAVQPTGLDMAQMKMEDFTSQRLEQNVSSHSDTDVTTQPSVNVISQQDIQESGVEVQLTPSTSDLCIAYYKSVEIIDILTRTV